jgi:hypothetical protein
MEDGTMSDKPAVASVISIKKPSFAEKFKSKNAPTISGVETLLTALPVLRIGEVDDWTRLHPSEDDYWSPELCFVSVPIKGAKRDVVHLIDDDLAVQYLPAKKIKRYRLALACKPHDVFFFCIVPSQNLDNAYNADALKACQLAQTKWVQAQSRKSEGAEGYEIKFALDQDDQKKAFPEPKWPSRSFDALLEVTFKNANIDHDRHPGLLRLIGAAQDLT